MALALIILMTTHGFMHFLSFFNAFGFRISHHEHDLARLQGILWILAGSLFMTAAILLLTQYRSWWIFAFIAIVISQYLIVLNWQNARFGTIVNALMLLMTSFGFLIWFITGH